MDDKKFSRFLKLLPSFKTGQRFGGRIDTAKKVGLFSERRFLIFTKRGPIEITFKPLHYSTAFLSLLVGFSSIIYWSAIGIYSAIDVAEKNIITEASATFALNDNKENNSFEAKSFNFKSDSSIYENIDNTDDKSQSNIAIPIKKSSKIIKDDFLNNYESNLKFKEFNFDQHMKTDSKSLIKEKKENKNPNKLISVPVNKKDNKELLFNKFKNQSGDLSKENNIILKEKSISLLDLNQKESKINQRKKTENDPVFLPPKLNERAQNYRLIASLNNDIKIMQDVFELLKIKINNNKIVDYKSLEKPDPSIDPESIEFLKTFKHRLDILSIYKNALEFIPLKPPMEHYYVSSKYGKRKHPVTKKWRFHHGIDLAGTWQENISVSADGLVIFAGFHGSFGKVIRIKHNFGITTTYGHLARIKVRKGEIVSEGQIIGKMGKTGRVDGAHLHYEIAVNGKSVNPAKFFKVGRKLINRNSIKSIVNKN